MTDAPGPAAPGPDAPGSMPLAVVVNIDGGARGNPGPAAIGAVIATPDGTVIEEAARPIGRTTNNVAEYQALLLGLERAGALGARRVSVINDSELIARQLTGVYRVKHPQLRALHTQARTALATFERWTIRSVPRAQNAAADALVNEALDRGAAIQRTPPRDSLHGRERPA